MKIKLYNYPILLLLLIFASCSSIDEGAIIGTWEINPDKCELSIDKKILNVLPKEISDQFGSQLGMVPTFFKQSLEYESGSTKVKFNEDGSYEIVEDFEAQIRERYESDIQWYKDNGEEVPEYLVEEMNYELESERNRIDDLLSILKWSIKENKFNITWFLPYGNEGVGGSEVSDELKKEIEERNKKAQEDAKIVIGFEIIELNDSDMLLSLDVESLIDVAKEKGLVDEAEKDFSRQFGGLEINPEKILKSAAKNIKLTLAFKKV